MNIRKENNKNDLLISWYLKGKVIKGNTKNLIKNKCYYFYSKCGTNKKLFHYIAQFNKIIDGDAIFINMSEVICDPDSSRLIRVMPIVTNLIIHNPEMHEFYELDDEDVQYKVLKQNIKI
jgi:hypothetical protein